MAVQRPPSPGLARRISSAVAHWIRGDMPATRVAPARRSYAAAQMNRLTEGWSAINLSANAELHTSLDILRARSRQLCRDNPHAAKFLQLVDTNVVGAQGFRHQARVYNAPNQPDTPANQAIEAAFAAWASRCDVTGRETLQGLCSLLIRSVARDGEYLVRVVRGRAAGNPENLALQVLDVDRLDTALNRPAGQGQNAIRMGVELNEWGRPVAYHLRRQAVNDPYSAVAREEPLRLPADEVLHGFMPMRPEQVRGVPWAHAAMKPLNDLGGYAEAAIVAARVGAAKMGFMVRDRDAPEVEGAGLGSQAEDGTMQMEADAGVIEQLPEGYRFEAFNPDYPSAMYDAFTKAHLRAIASGLGVSYHALSGDLEGVSFSSIRSGTLEERDHWSCVQRWFIQSFLEPLYGEWIANAVAFGLVKTANGSALPASKLDKFRAHAFVARRWDWVDPLRDIQADISALDAGLTSPQAVAAKMGQDYEDVLLEIKAAQDLRAAAGLTPTPNANRPAPAAQAAGEGE